MTKREKGGIEREARQIEQAIERARKAGVSPINPALARRVAELRTLLREGHSAPGAYTRPAA